MKIHGNKKVYVVIPHVHGNGGWYGFSTLAVVPLSRAKKFDCREKKWVDEETFDIGMPRICWEENPNKSLFVWNDDEIKWEKW